MADPTVTLTLNPAGPKYVIDEQCNMPSITAIAKLENVPPDSRAPVQYQWSVTVEFRGGAACPHSVSRATNHAPITELNGTTQYRIPFTQVRGGDLTVKLSVVYGNITLHAEIKGTITGTNPALSSLQNDAPKKAGFRKLMRLESALRQFYSNGCPLFSQDNLGGVGICQLTNPAPSDDEVWSWKANLAGGVSLWNQKERVARGYPAHVRASKEFTDQVKAFNDSRAAAAAAAAKAAGKPAPDTPAIKVIVPEYTADQLERDTLRGFNGYAGGLHEYRLKVDANGILVVTIDPTGQQGTAQWEQLTAADRNAFYDKAGIAANRRGDPNYVNDVEAKDSF